MNKNLLAALTAGLTLAATATPASAGEVAISINLDGIDLTSPEGLEIAHERIETSVVRACRRTSVSPIFFHLVHDAEEECIADGTSKALAQLESFVPVIEPEAKETVG